MRGEYREIVRPERLVTLESFEGFSDAVFAIALTLLIVEIKVPGSPEGSHGYPDLAAAMAEKWREFLALLLCYVVIGA